MNIDPHLSVDATAHSPFRSAEDVSLLSSLAQHYGLATGTAHVGTADERSCRGPVVGRVVPRREGVARTRVGPAAVLAYECS